MHPLLPIATATTASAASATSRRRAIAAIARSAASRELRVRGRCRRNSLRWTKTQRRIWNFQRLIALRGDDGSRRRHARPQLQVGVRHVDDRRVRDDILVRNRRITNLRHAPAEGAPGKRINAKIDLLTNLNSAHIGFRYRRLDLHFA